MPRSTSPVVPTLAALALGLAVGVLTSFLQAVLDFPWLALVNAASPWLTTAFVAGALQSRLRTACWLGMAATLLQVAGYYVTAELRGYDAGFTYVALWTVCAVVGGPVFGAAGRAWRTAAPAGLGIALLVAAYASEALVAYQLRLDYTPTATFFLVIAVVLAATLPLHRRQYGGLVRWLGPACAAGLAGQLVLGLVA
ncbi:DUF6518 family protein [Nocardioides sp. cx-173]|uniref:DUF6518 family protein n=1 Tax=Nocardioides sp. cx-173 TaxID=2898796 RepID=UPI001E420AE2|nr:DUF6518 family protein [Nocardioides sp. cx-173]MCD4524848.1 DUF6518 family protein [Nocardioides sp. cx-173]UGB43353.1 DUF6518 family protein [Nocardioides sp. cx-173]